MTNVFRKLLGQDEKFFDLLEASAVEAQTSVQLLAHLLQKPEEVPNLDEFVQTKRKDRRITEEITSELCKTFVTPLEREDIEALSFALYKIPKTVEKFGERFLLCHDQIRDVDFSRQFRLIEQTTETVVKMVRELRPPSHIREMKDQNAQLQYIENQADDLMLELMKELYDGKYDALRVMIVRDMYELLEKVIDRCRDAGNVIFQIVLKYS